MTRKTLLAIGLGALAAVALAAWVRHAGADEKGPKGKAPYVHAVIFTMKKDAPKGAESELVADCHAILAKIPSVRHLRVGRPAEKASPRFVRKDYSVGLLILFDDADGLLAYDAHPLHKQFVEKHVNNVDLEQLRVYDFSDQEK